MENPFGNVNSPGLRPSSPFDSPGVVARSGQGLNEGGVFLRPPEPSLVKRGQGELTLDDLPSYENRRADLKPEVRDYTDKLYARILEIYKKYGAHDLNSLIYKISESKTLRTKEDTTEVIKLIDQLGTALDKNELPASSELPPLEAFESMVREVEKSLPHHNIIGLDDWDQYQYSEGKISGRVKVMDRWADVGQDSVWIPIIRNHPILKMTCEGREQNINNCSDVVDIGGFLNGAVSLDQRIVPVINGEPIENVIDEDGQALKIMSCANIRNIDGELNGTVKFSDNRQLPVIQGRVIKQAIDEKGENISLLSAKDVRNSNGRLYANVRTVSLNAPIVDGVVIYGIKDSHGHRRTVVGFYQTSMENGKLNGIARFVDDNQDIISLPFLDSTLQDEVIDDEGKAVKIVSASNHCFFKNGKLNGSVMLENVMEYPVVDGVLKEFIRDPSGENEFILDGQDIRIIEGKINGKIQIENREEESFEWLPVVNGEIVKEIQGQKIYFKKEFDMTMAGGVFNGQVMVKDQDGKERIRLVLLGEFLH